MEERSKSGVIFDVEERSQVGLKGAGLVAEDEDLRGGWRKHCEGVGGLEVLV